MDIDVFLEALTPEQEEILIKKIEERQEQKRQNLFDQKIIELNNILQELNKNNFKIHLDQCRTITKFKASAYRDCIVAMYH